MKAIKWLGPPQHTDFGRVDTGKVYPLENVTTYDLSLVAEKWVAQGMAEWVPQPPTTISGVKPGEPMTTTIVNIKWEPLTEANDNVARFTTKPAKAKRTYKGGK